MSSEFYEQYKLLVTTTVAQSANTVAADNAQTTFQAGLLGGMAAAIALLAQQGTFTAYLLMLALVAGGAVGFTFLGGWRRLLSDSFRMVSDRYALLREMESSPNFPSDVPKLYSLEYAEGYRKLSRASRFSNRTFTIQDGWSLAYAVAILVGLAGIVALILGAMPAWVVHP